jgi:type I restriction enzyme S subunit
MARIDVTEEQEHIVKTLFSSYLPNTRVWVYGSRINGNSNENSDLDLVVFSSDKQRAGLAELRENLEESSLPFKVDLFVWELVPENFKSNIMKNHLEFL